MGGVLDAIARTTEALRRRRIIAGIAGAAVAIPLAVGRFPPRCRAWRLRLLLRAVTAVRDSPTLTHHPGVDVGAIGTEASRKDAIVAVDTARLARQVARADVAPELLCGCLAARPCLPPGIDAGLLPLGSIDPLQANARSGYFDAVAVEHPRLADQRRRRLRRPGSVRVEADQSDQQYESDERPGVAAALSIASRAWSVCPRSHRSRRRFTLDTSPESTPRTRHNISPNSRLKLACGPSRGAGSCTRSAGGRGRWPLPRWLAPARSFMSQRPHGRRHSGRTRRPNPVKPP